jgi:hypothetical protein
MGQQKPSLVATAHIGRHVAPKVVNETDALAIKIHTRKRKNGK